MVRVNLGWEVAGMVSRSRSLVGRDVAGLVARARAGAGNLGVIFGRASPWLK
jgi:hypothetical protein